MMIQEQMIERVRELCREDERVVACLMYGSWTKGEGDCFSDIEFYIFVADTAYDTFDPLAWVAQIAPVALYFRNEFDSGAAIFDNLVRGEFHFERTSDMARIRAWKQAAGFRNVEAMRMLDRTGELTTHLQFLHGPGPDRTTPANVQWLWHSYVNWMLFGANVLVRGEHVRALELLGHVQRYLLWLVRIHERSTAHWQTPSKHAEHDLSPAAYARYATCTAPLDARLLTDAYRAAWAWGRDLSRALSETHELDTHDHLVELLDAHFAGIFARSKPG